MTKRAFFKSLMGVVATVALAPELAFGTRLEMPRVETVTRQSVNDWIRENITEMEKLYVVGWQPH